MCSGYGGLDLAAHALLPNLELRWVSEIDRDASAVLAARHPDVPNIGDLTVAMWHSLEVAFVAMIVVVRKSSAIPTTSVPRTPA